MKANIYSHKTLIGTAELQVGDENMGCVYGEFLPTAEYYSNAQEVVWEFWERKDLDYKNWYALRLNVRLDNGFFLFPQGGYTIDDIKELPDQPKRIDIAGIAHKLLIDFFLTEPPRPFVEKPWGSISIEQKIAFEDELKKELGLTKQVLFGLLRSKQLDHPLTDAEFSALCHDQRNDDVLFEITKPNSDKQFAVVHLTWKRKKEKEGYPATQLFTDFDEFKYRKMYPDKAEWEY